MYLLYLYIYIVYNVAASHDNDSQFVAVVVTKQTNFCPLSSTLELLSLCLCVQVAVSHSPHSLTLAILLPLVGLVM